jgi:N-formylglutamate deformylase
MRQAPYWTLTWSESPLVAAAIHDGHEVREEVAALLALDERDRLREEDPFTGTWTDVAGTRIIGRRSRFEVDLNRPRDRAVFLSPEDAWGLHVWKETPPAEVIARSLEGYDAYYAEVHQLLTELTDRFKRCLVLDLHSYNHRRGGPDGPLADPTENPEVNIGTGTMDRERWAPVVDRLMDDLARFDFLGGRLDVRENVKFQGGYFPRWIHETFPESVCCIAIEVKKFFMNEWTGEPDIRALRAIRQAIRSTAPGLLEELEGL